MTVWTDSHCHLQLGRSGRPAGSAGSAGSPAPGDAGPDPAIWRALAEGVERMVCVGTDVESSLHAVALAGRHPEVYATVGLHPHDASKLGAEWGHLEPLAHDERVVGIGEAGFDFHYEHSPRDEQEVAFRYQIRLAKRLGRALVVHSREAWPETFGVLDDEGPPDRLVFHCFTGGPGEARRALDLGAYLSFSGIVSFAAAGDVRDAAVITPPDRLLVETDSPYLAPEPHRGQPNEPAYLPLVGRALAAARGVEPGEVAAVTHANAARLFGLDDAGG